VTVKDLEFCLAQLRHAYQQLHANRVVDQRSFASLIESVIRRLEKEQTK
jgi:hypothetical protein